VSWASFRLRVRLALTALGRIGDRVVDHERLPANGGLQADGGSLSAAADGPPSSVRVPLRSSPEEARALPPALTRPTRIPDESRARETHGRGVETLLSHRRETRSLPIAGSSPGPRFGSTHAPGAPAGIGNDGAFLSYMSHLRTPFRPHGSRARPPRRAGEDLGRRGFSFTISHISATNVPSIQTVTRVGWRSIGLMVFSRRGKLLYARVARTAGSPCASSPG